MLSRLLHPLVKTEKNYLPWNW